MDGLKGFPEAIEAIYSRTEVQLCIIHVVRASLNYVPWKMGKPVAADLQTIYRAGTAEAEHSLQDVSTPFARSADHTPPAELQRLSVNAYDYNPLRALPHPAPDSRHDDGANYSCECAHEERQIPGTRQQPGCTYRTHTGAEEKQNNFVDVHVYSPA